MTSLGSVEMLFANFKTNVGKKEGKRMKKKEGDKIEEHFKLSFKQW